MIATVHIADLGARGTIRAIRHRPRTDAVDGLRWCEVAAAVPLASKMPPTLRRAVLLAVWDDEDSAQAGRETEAFTPFDGGFHAMLRPIRAFGTWPELPEDVPRSRSTPHDGPVIVLTLGRLKLGQTIRFFRASRPAERAAVTAGGFVWGTAAARPPFVATVSIWRNSDAAVGYAYDHAEAAHPQAVAAQRRKDFHHQSAFIRFTPARTSGGLEHPNAMPSDPLGTPPPT